MPRPALGRYRSDVSIRIRLCYGHETLELQVTDDARALGGRGPRGRQRDGHGLIGMRERVALFGGELEVGPLAGGGFRVAARLPLDPAIVPR